MISPIIEQQGVVKYFMYCTSVKVYFFWCVYVFQEYRCNFQAGRQAERKKDKESEFQKV